MEGSDESQKRCKLKVDMDELEMAYDNGSIEIRYFLDRETGEVVAITDEDCEALQELYDELDEDDLDSRFEGALDERDLPTWMKDGILQAHKVETGFGDRFIRVPQVDSWEGYSDMQDFIETVENVGLRERLEDAIDGRGAFRRFKDALARYANGEEQWFQFKSGRLRERILEWLEDEGIEPILE